MKSNGNSMAGEDAESTQREFGFKAVVFDLDDTLIQSSLCYKTIRTELAIPEDQFILEFLASLDETTRLPKLVRLEEIELAAAAGARLISGVDSMLAQLQQAQVKIGLLTRNCRKVSEHVVQKFALPVHLIITREDAPPKPDPRGLEIFLEKWSIPKERLLFVGDFRFDIECGKRAGVKTAHFTNDQIATEDYAPDFVIKNYSEFFTVITEAPECK